MNNQEQKKLAKWLNKLQRESWELELLVSGFSIFLLLGALKSLRDAKASVSLASQYSEGDNILTFGYAFLVAACFFIIINLILHVLLRGIWISTIGLRYVSGDIDFDSLRLAPKFDRLLRKKVTGFDRYILNLEKICSVLFAFTFLLVFMLMSLVLYIVFFMFLTNHALQKILLYLPAALEDLLVFIVAGGLFFMGVIYFIDFITLGFLKRIKWFSHIYRPIYRFMSLITLSFLYRPIYYNLIDNKFGRIAGYLLAPYFLFLAYIALLNVHSHIWFPDTAGTAQMYNKHYDDLSDGTSLIKTGSLPSRFVRNGFLQLFIAYIPKDDNAALQMLCPAFKPFNKEGIGSGVHFKLNNKSSQRTEAPDSALVCFSNLYKIWVDDSLFAQPSLHFYRHPNNHEYGLTTIMDVSYLPHGEHLVKVEKKSRKTGEDRDSLVISPFFQIPFWKE